MAVLIEDTDQCNSPAFRSKATAFVVLEEQVRRGGVIRPACPSNSGAGAGGVDAMPVKRVANQKLKIKLHATFVDSNS